MASLEQRADRYRIIFRLGGKKFHHPLKNASAKEAEACRVRLEENLRLLERGRLELPTGADVATFLLSDGKRSTRPTAPQTLTLRDLIELHQTKLPTGVMEANSLATMALHLKHVAAHFGEGFRSKR